MIALNLCWIVWIIPKGNESCLYKRGRGEAHRRLYEMKAKKLL